LSPKTYENDGKKTLVLDLDETMIHSWFKPIRDPDIFLEVKIKNKFSKIYVLVRPGVQEFLKEMQKLYEVVFFTASVSTYAIPLINKLDRNRYKHQMLFRQH
jgi:carboxy-terminal domain RNA polymerase II polypeptide A small phosphatase